MKEYKILVHRDSLFIGSFQEDERKLADFLNAEARRGWRVVAIDRSYEPVALLLKRKTYTVIFERDLDNSGRVASNGTRSFGGDAPLYMRKSSDIRVSTLGS